MELKENLKDTMTKRYHQPGHEGVTSAVDKLQQEVGGWLRGAFLGPRGSPQGGWGGHSAAAFSLQFHCCGSNNSQDWRDSEWIRSGEAGGRLVPDSCCKTVVAHCGQRDHASNIYKVEVGGGPGPRGRGAGCGDLPAFSAHPHLRPQGGCITKLETFIQEHLRVIGAVGIGIACVQVRPGGAGRGRGH